MVKRRMKTLIDRRRNLPRLIGFIILCQSLLRSLRIEARRESGVKAHAVFFGCSGFVLSRDHCGTPFMDLTGCSISLLFLSTTTTTYRPHGPHGLHGPFPLPRMSECFSRGG